MQLNDPELLKQQAFIDGVWTGDRQVEVTNPATGEVLAKVPNLGANETIRAVEAAHAAFAGWAATTAGERSAVMRRWFEFIRAARDDLAQLMTAEQGKPLAEALGEVDYAASFIEYYAEEAKRITGETIPAPASDRRIVVLRQPVGVVGAITPWNFPAAMITRKIAPAIAVGCTAVCKPAPETPLTALALAELASRAGVPAGVINIVTGDATKIGPVLTSHPKVRAITFTGSTAVGRLLMEQSAPTIKRVGLELGGNAPFIVFDDADLDAAVAGAMASKYRNTGQTCVCANRFLIQEGIYDAFAERLGEAVKQLKVGAGTEAGVNQGPLINENAVKKVEAHIADAVENGARIIIGGKRHALGRTYFEPTILADVTAAMKVAREETFGPVAPLFRFTDEADAIALANDTESGLAAYFYTRDIGRVWRVCEALEYGMVGVNEGVISTTVAPFGGVKQSGLGREGGSHGVDEFLETKYVMMAGLDR
ncbi:MAG: NAD-dependent succinate-semialdehyde dehydrogenase [Alphaproteobacteria bacterium]